MCIVDFSPNSISMMTVSTDPESGWRLRDEGAVEHYKAFWVYKHSVEFVPSDAKLEDYMIDPSETPQHRAYELPY